MKCPNCGKELTNVYASRSVELEKATNGVDWIEKYVFMSDVCCEHCHQELSKEEVDELGIKGY